MRITLPADALADAATYAAKSISNRPPVPILSGLLIEAAADHVRLSGFDYERSSRTTAAADVTEPGNVILSGKLFTDIVRKFGRKQLTLTVSDNRATITAGNAQFELSAMPAGDYPAMPALPETAATIDGDTLANIVSYVSGAASTDDTLPILVGIEVHAEAGRLTLRATDRYRLAEASMPWPGQDFKTTVKAKWLTDAVKTLAGETQILTSDAAIGLRCGNQATTTTLIDGDYPKIRSLFPDHTPTTVTVDKGELLDVLGRIALVAERNTPVKLTITDGEITVEAGAGNEAQGRETLPCQLDGDPITAAYNPAYLHWSLTAIPGDTVDLGYTTTPKPTLITPAGDNDASIRHLIMPIRLPS